MFNVRACATLFTVFVFNSFLVIAVAHAGESALSPQHFIKDGLAIYLGMLPAEMIDGHVADPMHGGLPTGPNRYHISIAIFDAQTGERISNAKVFVRVNNRIGVGPDAFKALEGMEMNGKLMYGNYFSLRTAGPYRIDVKILRDKTGDPIQVTFDYDFAHG